MSVEEPFFSAAGISKRFGDRRVLEHASLAVEAGEIVGLLGANGAGKSTFLNIATGLLRPDAGAVRIGGDPVGRSRAAAHRFGAVAQETSVYPTLTVRENLLSFAGLYGIRGRTARARADEAIASLGLETCAGMRAEALSGGQRRRLHTAIALVHRPPLLFLDEPTVGSDVQSRQQIVDLIHRLSAAGTAVIYTTHYLSELEGMNATISVLQNRRIRSYGSVTEVIDTWGASEVAMRIGQNGGPPPPLEGWRSAGEWLISDTAGVDPARRLAEGLTALGGHATEVLDVDIRRSSLENAYLRLVGAADQEVAHVAA